MNKKIIASMTVILAAVAIIVGGTTAYFSDTEKSTGNTFTAGNIDLTVDSECYYGSGANLTACPADAEHGNWALTDLEEGVHKFFNFTDIKPGSWGENTISLHLENNPAWAWLKIDPKVNAENGCNEPEKEAEPGCENDDIGELAGNLSFLIWQDDADIQQTGGECNNILDAGEHIFKNGKINACEVIDLNETCSTTPGCSNIQPLLPENNPYCVGVMWCAGDWVVDPTSGDYDCDGIAIGNEAQGDGLTLDIELDVVQSMNNANAQGGPVCAIP